MCIFHCMFKVKYVCWCIALVLLLHPTTSIIQILCFACGHILVALSISAFFFSPQHFWNKKKVLVPWKMVLQIIKFWSMANLTNYWLRHIAFPFCLDSGANMWILICCSVWPHILKPEWCFSVVIFITDLFCIFLSYRDQNIILRCYTIFGLWGVVVSIWLLFYYVSGSMSWSSGLDGFDSRGKAIVWHNDDFRPGFFL